MISQTMIAVRDVAASSQWYQQILGATSGHGGHEYERLMYGHQLILQLHHWDTQEHPHMGDPSVKPHGHGVLLWFETSHFNDTIDRARQFHAEILLEPFVNPLAQHRECWIKDPDGYVVVIASSHGDV